MLNVKKLLTKIIDWVKQISDKIGNTTMGTTATTITGAIKEHSDKIGSVAMGTDATTITGAIRQNHDKINNLKTKTNDYMKLEGGTASITIAGNNYASQDVSVTIPTGYKYAGVVRAWIPSNGVLCYNAYQNSSETTSTKIVITVAGKNMGSNSVTTTAYVTVAFIKNNT